MALMPEGKRKQEATLMNVLDCVVSDPSKGNQWLGVDRIRESLRESIRENLIFRASLLVHRLVCQIFYEFGLKP